MLFGGTVPPNKTLFGRTVPPNNTLFGGTVPPNNTPDSETWNLMQWKVLDLWMQACKYAGMHVSKYTSMQVCKYTIIKVYKYVNKYANSYTS